LTCTTKIKAIDENTITLAPLDGFKVYGDLVVEFSSLYNDISADWSYLKKSEGRGTEQLPEGVSGFMRFEDCIECGACISACPVTHKTKGFIGPASLAALSNALKNPAHKSKALLSIAGSTRGVRLCERAFSCSRVCPTRVHPAKHISELRRFLKDE
jgi:succinate dehydrogenase/fumarate reductase iron-sulfur protein